MTDSPPPSDRPRTRQKPGFCAVPACPFCRRRHRPGPGRAGADASVESRDRGPAAAGKTADPDARRATGAIVLAEPEPAPPIAPADFKSLSADLSGFSMKPPRAQQRARAAGVRSLRAHAAPGEGRHDREDAGRHRRAGSRSQADRTRSSQALLKKKKLAAGEEIELLLQNVPEQPDAPRVLSLSVRPQPEREYIITRRDDGTYDGEEKIYKVSPRIVRVEANATARCEQSGVRPARRRQAMVEFIRALSYDVDFQRELKEGMKFTVLLEQLVTSDGRVTHPGRLLAGELRLLQAHGDGDPLPPAGRRRRLLQSQGRERRALLPAHADGRLEDHLALRHARASDPGLQRPACRRRLRRAAGHADPRRRRRQGGDGRAERRLRPLREAAAHQRRRHRPTRTCRGSVPASSPASRCARAR